jgi:radical SAM protein with 4Fe4S-binding SPASM domain
MLEKIIKEGELKVWSLYRDQLRNEHKLKYLFWECTLRCNFFCKHCGSNAGVIDSKSKPELSTGEIMKAFEQIAKNFNPKEIFIYVTGGEPLVRSDIFEVMERVNKLGFSWGMVTNGFLVNQDIITKMRNAGMSSVVVSIDGLKESHDIFRGVEGSYKAAIDAVKALAGNKFLNSLQITTVVHRDNIDLLEEMYNTFLPLGITSWRLMNVEPIGRAEKNKHILLDSKSIKKLLHFIKEKRKKTTIDISYGCSGFLGTDFEGAVRARYFICDTGINIASILCNGDIFVCPNVPRIRELIQGNVKYDNFSEIWYNKFEIFRNKDRTSCQTCKACAHWSNCLGGSFHLWDFDRQAPRLCYPYLLS